MRNKLIIGGLIAILVIALISVPIVTASSNPLRKSAEQIRKSILELTPIGTSMEDVLAVVNNELWEVDYVSDGRDENRFLSEDCQKTIRVFLGKYRGNYFGGKNIIETVFDIMISRTHVTAFWGFDKNSELTE